MDYKYLSFDKKSHYPATMTMRFFPYDFEVIKKDQTKKLLELWEENKKSISINNYHQFKLNMMSCSNRKNKKGLLYRNYFAPSKNAFIAEIILTDVEIKTYGLNTMPLIAMSKSNYKPTDYLKNKNIIVDNGKLIKCSEITVKVTDIDLLAFYLMYDFKIAKCNYLETTNKFKYADDYIQSTLRYHLVNKNEISLLIKGKKQIENIVDFNGQKIFSDETIANFYKMPETEKKNFLEFYYSQIKSSGVNNQYGINVQKIVNDNIFFNLREYKYQKDEDVIQGCYGTQTSRDYITGIYITAYARLDLAFMTYIIYREGKNTNVVYWDTDSIKLLIPLDEIEKITKLFNWYNNKIKKIREQSEKRYGTLFNLGIWENDGEYKFFYSMGAKKYLVCDYNTNEIIVTNAGINKKIFSSFLNNKYHKFIKSGLDEYSAFKKLLFEFYHPNVNLGSDVTGRKIINYPYIREEQINLQTLDENKDKIKISQYPCALITECDYMLGGLNGFNLINRQHYQFCKTLQKNENINFICNTDYNEVGKITFNSSDDFTDFIIDNN